MTDMSRAREAYKMAVISGPLSRGQDGDIDAGLLAAKEFMQEPCRACEAMKLTMRDGKLDFVAVEQPQPKSAFIPTTVCGGALVSCQPQPEAPADVVERMLDAWTQAKDQDFSGTRGDCLNLMTAAFHVAQEWFEREKRQALKEQEERLLSVAVEALEKLARLGNGSHYGNSDGNIIAQEALAELSSRQRRLILRWSM